MRARRFDTSVPGASYRRPCYSHSSMGGQEGTITWNLTFGPSLRVSNDLAIGTWQYRAGDWGSRRIGRVDLGKRGKNPFAKPLDPGHQFPSLQHSAGLWVCLAYECLGEALKRNLHRPYPTRLGSPPKGRKLRPQRRDRTSCVKRERTLACARGSSESLRTLGIDYIDLYMPWPRRYHTGEERMRAGSAC